MPDKPLSTLVSWLEADLSSPEVQSRLAGNRAAILEAAAAVEEDFRVRILQVAENTISLTEDGKRVLQWAKHHISDANPTASILRRRSVSPRRLASPGPSEDEVYQLVTAATCGPDHGRLHPWRVISFPASSRMALADVFVAEKLRRDPLSGEEDIERARVHALAPPCLLAFVVAIASGTTVPTQEQWLAAGSALGYLLLAASELGYGASILSGERCHDDELKSCLGLASHEVLAGFVSVGTIAKAPPPRQPVTLRSVFSIWQPVRGKTAQMVDMSKR